MPVKLEELNNPQTKNSFFSVRKDNGEIGTCPHRQMIPIMQNSNIYGGKQGIKMVNQACTSDCMAFFPLKLAGEKEGDPEKNYMQCMVDKFKHLITEIVPLKEKESSLKIVR